MAFITVTYSFTNGAVISASEHNTNFADIIAGTSDGTKDFSINALTLAGNFTANGTTNTLGNASSDDLVVNASLASTIAIKTNNTYGIGGAALGVTGVYFSSAASYTTRVVFGSGVANVTWTLPGTGGTNGFGLQTDGSGTFSYAPMQTDINTVTDNDYTVTDTDGYQMILLSTGNSNRTVTLPTAADNTDRTLHIKKVDTGTGTVIIDGESSETIDGATTVTLRTQYEFVTIKCNGSAWRLISADGLGLPDEIATRRGLKIYAHGTSYNGGNAPTITLAAGGGTLSSINSSWFIPRQMQDGTWMMDYCFYAQLSSTSRTQAQFAINGVTFPSGFRQAVCAFIEASVAMYHMNIDADRIELNFATSSATWFLVQGQAKLAAKPTWAY